MECAGETRSHDREEEEEEEEVPGEWLERESSVAEDEERKEGGGTGDDDEVGDEEEEPGSPSPSELRLSSPPHPPSPLHPPSPSSSLPTLSSPPRLPSPPPIPPLSPPPSSSPSPPVEASVALPPLLPSSSTPPPASPPSPPPSLPLSSSPPPSSSSPLPPSSSPPSPSAGPQEAVVAQLNQLQQTVVSHILQYQAGVIAQFQQLQQQMLSQLTSSNSGGVSISPAPHITITPQPLALSTPQSSSTTTSGTPPRVTNNHDHQNKNLRKRRASMMTFSPGTDDTNNGEFQFKRKRTAFNEKQYRVLETTFEHNNFPDPIDQHCIALRIKTPYRSIKMWFQNRRASVRKRLQPDEKGSTSPDCKSVVKNASDPDARWYCTQCPATFIAKKFLENHKEAHQRETLHCPHCNMGFTHKVLLDTHRISKCSSSTGVDLTHLKDENMDEGEMKVLQPQSDQHPATSTPLHAGLPLLLLQKLQKQECQPPSSSPPPLIDSKALLQIQQNPLLLQQQQLMQQLLLAQLQQAQRARLVINAEEENQEIEKQEEEKLEDMETEERVVVKEEKHIKEEKLDFDTTTTESIEEDKQKDVTSHQEQLKQVLQQQIQQLQQQQLQLQLQQIQQKQMEKQLLLQQQQEERKQEEAEEVEKRSLTLGGLTIFPVHSEGGLKVRVKEEVIHSAPSEDKPPHQLTLQDQISTILRSHGLKTMLKIKKEPGERGEDGEDNGLGEVPPSRERESMQEQIQAILKHQEQLRRKVEKPDSSDVTEVREMCTSSSSTSSSNMKRHRRRTTVFNEVQLRTLYLHFTYCNFPDPSMFRIIGHITKLEPQVIKIWFQNERSRQRKRALHFMDEVNSKEKPYKCRDCGMSFAMLTFLVKHSMRHNGDTNQDATVRTCPLCLQKWNREIFPAHLKSSHNVNWSLVDDKFGSSLVCHLCQEKFNDQDSLLVHKHKHLTDDYGVPPQCKFCKTTFVNAICLEAHMETHRLHEWNYKCNICDTIFHDKVLLASHKMGHGVPLAPVSTTDRSQSQLQHTSVRALHSKGQKMVVGISAITDLGQLSESNETNINLDLVKVENVDTSSTPAVSNAGTLATSQATTIIPQTILAQQPSTIITPSALSNMSLPSSSGPVSYVKLIPVQLIPVSSINSNNNSGGGQKSTSTLTTVSAGGPTTPTAATTTTFISVPISLKGSTETNPILNYLLEASPSPTKSAEEKQGKKTRALPNLIPISQSPTLPATDTSPKILPLLEPIKTGKDIKNGINVDGQICETAEEADALKGEGETTPGKQVTREGDPRDPQDPATPFVPDSLRVYQLTTKKRYVPILPMLPVPLAPKDPAKATATSPGAAPVTPLAATTATIKVAVSQRPQRTRNMPNKKLWQTFDPVGYKRRRAPTYFTNGQREVMEAHFNHDNFPEPGEQMAIAHQLGIDYPVVKTWFQNTRKNIRKQLKEDAENYELDGPFHCQRCNVAFISRGALDQHRDGHEQETAYHCGECGVYFTHPVVFNTHLMSHIGEVNNTSFIDPSAKGGESKRRVFSEEESVSAPGVPAETSPQESSEDEGSETDSQDEIEDQEGDSATPDDPGNPEKEPQDSDDAENYDPSMAVECILDNSSGEEQEPEEESQGESHKCGTCGESFASLIALKEHYTHCSFKKQSQRRVGGWRRWKKGRRARRRQREAGEVRCYECRALFPDRQAYLTHFDSAKCSAARQRIEYTDEEQAILVTHYNDSNFPMPSEMSLLAKRLGVRYRQIMHWFQNRRSKERKQQKEKKYPPAECGDCKSTFVTSGNLKKHREVMHGQLSSTLSEFACLAPNCGAVFTNADLLVTHRLAHQTHAQAQLGGGSMVVGVGGGGCGPLWRNYTVLEAHYGDNNFPDPMDIGFIARRLQVDPLHIHLWFKDRRNQHLRKLEESGREVMEGDLGVSCQRALSKVCSTCDAAFICQTDLDTHKEMHKSSWAQTCSMCGREYSNVIALETHWIRHGVEVKREAAPASPSSLSSPAVASSREGRAEKSAKASFNSAQLKVLDTHYHHNNFPGATEVWLVAKRLGLRPRQVTHWFQNKRGRDRRMQKLSQPSSHLCTLCGAAFICDRFLRTHRKLHKSLQRHSCEKCSAIFLSSILLETHVLYHDIAPKTKAVFRKPPDGTRDPVTQGQLRTGQFVDSDDSEGSEPKLKIDLNIPSLQQLGEDNTGSDVMEDTNTESTLSVYIDNAEGSQDVTQEDDIDIECDSEMVEGSFENLQITSKESNGVEFEKADDEISAILKDAGIVVRDSTEFVGQASTESSQTARKTGNKDDLTESNERLEDRSSGRKEKKSDVGDEFLLNDEEFCMEEDALITLEKSVVHEEVFFDDNTDSDSDDDEDEPRLKIVSAYTISPVVRNSQLGGRQ